MSKQVEVTLGCGKCGSRFKSTLYRSIWGEHAENRELVFSDAINMVECPLCNSRSRAPCALMYVDLKKNFVVWYEPTPDQGIDAELPVYARMFGPNCCYVTAPRIADWQSFKDTIEKFERGELVARPPSPEHARAAMRTHLGSLPKKKSGCLIAVLLIGATGLGLGIAAKRFVWGPEASHTASAQP